jgi:hypothetical protein
MAHHHDTLFNALCDEIQELAPREDSKRTRHLWGVEGALGHPSEKARRLKCLRELVRILRICRRAYAAQVEAALALPVRFFSSLSLYRAGFSAPLDDAADKLVELLASTQSDLNVVAKIQILRDDNKFHLGEEFTHHGWSRAESRIARRGGELSADLIAYTWRAGGMSWEKFVECANQLRDELIEQFSPAADDPRIARTLEVMKSAKFPTDPEAGDDDGDSR